MRDLAAAREMFERALAGKESALGAAHPNTLGTMGNLAALLANQGDERREVAYAVYSRQGVRDIHNFPSATTLEYD